ncbi:ubiquitin-fold modifier-conjugating enzyme 1 [Coturnix japonica]|uniref:ubiquitin-fold modifier-conjugating enzyme 1 n=1 Tax=Coturnix japonica TaxID=93934 RepID=UPI000777BCE2|nr:ubiquitin-fold modifier-conjugating enzyme 1 [Coturnix japonica]
MADEAARRAVAAVPLLRSAAGPRDRERWAERLKEEYQALIQYVEHNKQLPPPQPPCRGGKICLSDHFKPLWARNVPKFGLAHLMALGLGPWLAVEIPDLVAKGLIQHKEK